MAVPDIMAAVHFSNVFMSKVYEDLFTIWEWIMMEKLHIAPWERNLYSAILVVPETFDTRGISLELFILLKFSSLFIWALIEMFIMLPVSIQGLGRRCSPLSQEKCSLFLSRTQLYAASLVSNSDFSYHLLQTEIKEMLTIVLQDLRFGSAVVHQV